MVSSIRIARDDLTHPGVIALIMLHLREAHANSPPDAVFALDLTGLRDPAVALWAAWDGDVVCGLGAMKQLDTGHGELKSMRTAPTHVRRGVGAALLQHLIGEARTRGYRRLSLETGSNAAYAPARALYARFGFAECGPFGTYADTAFSRYYTLEFEANA